MAKDIIMKSWCWQEKGEPSKSLILKERASRELEEDEVLIENTYIGLNPVDWKLIESAQYYGIKTIFPE